MTRENYRLAWRVRTAVLSDLEQITDLWLRARRRARPAIPTPVHTDDEVHRWFADVVLPERDVWLAVDPYPSVDPYRSVLGLLVLDGGWVDQLYVDPDHLGKGIGSRLLSVAKARSPEVLQLWTFAANHRARNFYERHGFVITDRTDGARNEEEAPDILYCWTAG
jgi:GNAT superfamily N-acetyltransferase